MTQREALKYVGNMAQIAGITEKTFSRARLRGVSSYDRKTGSDLEYSLLPDKCLDILDLRYKGYNIGFLAKNGLVAPYFGYPLENELMSTGRRACSTPAD